MKTSLATAASLILLSAGFFLSAAHAQGGLAPGAGGGMAPGAAPGAGSGLAPGAGGGIAPGAVTAPSLAPAGMGEPAIGLPPDVPLVPRRRGDRHHHAHPH